VRVVDLAPEHESIYLVCLKDWDPDETESRKARWFGRMKGQGLRVKLALDDDDRAGGMIQYLPIEHAAVLGNDLYFVQCIWVHGYEQGIGNVQGRGMGQALLHAAEEDVRALGGKGLAAWGMDFPYWMPAAWYEGQGYVRVDRKGSQVLVWKPFDDDAIPPKWLRRRKTPAAVPGQVTVMAFINGWCRSSCRTFEAAREAAAAFGDEVVFQEVDTSDRAVLLEWGIEDALFIDEQEVNPAGPPPDREQIEQLIRQRLPGGD
jgi:hypothetical protein